MMPNFGLPTELAELADEYDFLNELGRGGSAIVYRARDRALGRDVAIKVVHPRPASPDDDPVARLAREARTVAQLQHPGIVAVYAVRRLHAGGLALVMQLVPGLTLKAAILRGGPFGARRAEEVLRDVARALAYAHARQIVHRDVKPENIFLDADTGRALLADFGIARSTEADSLTMTGTAIGTPFYMSPEQVDGKPVDGRSDLYSLGLVAWEMLTGLRPWDGASLYHVIYKQKHDELPPIEALRCDVPRRLQYIIERMLQKHPAARWAGADGLLAQLDQTILPSDYGRWQAALPGRIVRHRAVAGAQRATPQQPERAAIAAATVQFAPRAGGTAGLPDSQAPSPPSTVQPTTVQPEAVARVVAAEIATTEDGGGPAYDTIAPTWAYADSDVLQHGARTWGRRIAGAAALAGVIVVATALTSKANDPRPKPISTRILADPGPLTKQDLVHAPIGSRWSARDTSGNKTQRAAVPVGFTPDLLGVGARHQCTVTLARAAQCWGENAGGQLGDGSQLKSTRLPRAVAGVMRYSALGAGDAHTCGVTDTGDVYCWGANGDGQLGDGTTVQRSAPVRVAGTGTYRTVRGGRAHTCALEIDGQVRCWGANGSGQLGDGTRDSRPVPGFVHLPPHATAVAIAVGDEHGCAILNDDRVMCWGANASGQLGRVRGGEADVPVQVFGVHATTITAGSAHTCVVLTAGPIRCWGRDDAGQLGAGPMNADATGRLTVIPGGEDVRALTAGVAHSCALTRSGSAWCWGQTVAGFRRAPLRTGRGPYAALASGGTRNCATRVGDGAECWFGADVSVRGTRVIRAAAPRRDDGREQE